MEKKKKKRKGKRDRERERKGQKGKKRDCVTNAFSLLFRRCPLCQFNFFPKAHSFYPEFFAFPKIPKKTNISEKELALKPKYGKN